MSERFASAFPVLVTALFGLAQPLFSQSTTEAETKPPAEIKLSTLAEPPLWQKLDVYQGKISRKELERRFTLYSPEGGIYQYLTVEDHTLKLYSDRDKTLLAWELKLAGKTDPPSPFTRYDFPYALPELRNASTEQPLKGLRIALDPGHIGGEWANLEERYFRIRNGPEVKEGDLTLITCQLIAPLLEAAGAEIVWTRTQAEPATTLRPENLTFEGITLLHRRLPRASRYSTAKLLKEVRWHEELAFYRPAEIAARADLIHQWQPDLTVCIHFNAAPWRSSRYPRLVSANKLVVFVLGSFMPDELEYDDQKYTLLSKLLEGSASLELGVSESIAERMKSGWGWRPENYDSWDASHRVGTNPYVWSRNLLANRLFDGPTVFVEGPYMNDKGMYPRLIAGDYEGLKEINGEQVRSIYREYAEIVANGIIDYYRKGLEPQKALP